MVTVHPVPSGTSQNNDTESILHIYCISIDKNFIEFDKSLAIVHVDSKLLCRFASYQIGDSNLFLSPNHYDTVINVTVRCVITHVDSD